MSNFETRFFLTQNQERLPEGLKRVFERIGGVPLRLRFNNLSTAEALSVNKYGFAVIDTNRYGLAPASLANLPLERNSEGALNNFLENLRWAEHRFW